MDDERTPPEEVEPQLPELPKTCFPPLRLMRKTAPRC